MDAGPRHERDLFSVFMGIAMTALATLGLAGCGGGSAGMGGLWDGAGSLFAGSPTLALAPIVGVPDKVTSDLTQAMIASGRDRNLTIVPGTTSSDSGYTLRGYLLASPDSRGSKISYIWDVNDAKGTRITRVTGEETVARGSRSNPWSGVDSTVIRSIANKSTSKLAAALPGGRSGSSAPSVAAAPSSTSSGRSAAATSAAATSTAAARPPTQSKPKPSGVLVASVVGAPGDGRRSLTTALKKKLYAGGVKLANGAASNVYTVKGIVKLTSAGSGKEKIRIDWQVLDPRGKRVGTISQQNTIPKGSLNGPWGAIADVAAGAAAPKIIKLIPKSS